VEYFYWRYLYLIDMFVVHLFLLVEGDILLMFAILFLWWICSHWPWACTHYDGSLWLKKFHFAVVYFIHLHCGKRLQIVVTIETWG
jgi:uncharacterized membrane protein YeiB